MKLLPPQAARPPRATINASAYSISRQLRRRAGTPTKKTRNVASAPPLAHPRSSLLALGIALATLAAVEVTVMVAVPVVVSELKVTEELPIEQVGRSAAPAGDEVNAQAIDTIPE